MTSSYDNVLLFCNVTSIYHSLERNIYSLLNFLVITKSNSIRYELLEKNKFSIQFIWLTLLFVTILFMNPSTLFVQMDLMTHQTLVCVLNMKLQWNPFHGAYSGVQFHECAPTLTSFHLSVTKFSWIKSVMLSFVCCNHWVAPLLSYNILPQSKSPDYINFTTSLYFYRPEWWKNN